MKTKNFVTKKLFYKKWLYKIVIQCGGISYLHRQGIDYIKQIVPLPGYPNSWRRNSSETIIANRANLIKIADVLETVLKDKGYQIRTESDCSAIFTNDESLINYIANELPEFIKETHSPNSDVEAAYLTSNKNKIICEELPLDGYKFKIHFKNGSGMSFSTKQGFLKWSSKFSDGRIHIPPGVRSMLEEVASNSYFYGQYFYAKDQKIANMAMMFLSDHLNKAEEFVLKSEVNA